MLDHTPSIQSRDLAKSLYLHTRCHKYSYSRTAWCFVFLSQGRYIRIKFCHSSCKISRQVTWTRKCWQEEEKDAKMWTAFFSVKTYFRIVAQSTCLHHNKVCSLQLHRLLIGPYWQSSSICAQLKDKAVGIGTTAIVTQTSTNATDEAFPHSSEPVASQRPNPPRHAAETAPSTTHAAQHRAIAKATRTFFF